jgi:hypothetical protein
MSVSIELDIVIISARHTICEFNTVTVLHYANNYITFGVLMDKVS